MALAAPFCCFVAGGGRQDSSAALSGCDLPNYFTRRRRFRRKGWPPPTSRDTWTADHLPPRAAGMPRSSKPAAMARSDSQPAACSSLIVGARSTALLRARSCRVALPAARALAVKRAPRSPPSFTPRRLAAREPLLCGPRSSRPRAPQRSPFAATGICPLPPRSWEDRQTAY